MADSRTKPQIIEAVFLIENRHAKAFIKQLEWLAMPYSSEPAGNAERVTFEVADPANLFWLGKYFYREIDKKTTDD
jgi:hypothetical protein